MISVVALILFTFSGRQTPLWSFEPQEFPIDVYLSCGLFVFMVLIARTNITGPLRYALNTYDVSIVQGILQSPSSCLLILLVLYFLGISRLSILALTTVAWRYNYERHREAVEQCSRWAEEQCAQANTLIGDAQREIESLQSQETNALNMLHSAIRDVRQAQNIHAIDFFDQSCEAWTGLRRIVTASEEAATAVENASFTVEELQELINNNTNNNGDDEDESDESGDEDTQGHEQQAHQSSTTERGNPKIQQAQNKLKELYNLTKDAEKQVKRAAEAEKEFEKAKDRVITRQNLEQLNITQVSRAANELSSEVDEARKTYRTAVKFAQIARDMASKAVGEIVMGKVSASKSLVEEVEKILEGLSNNLTAIVGNVDVARTKLHQATGKYQSVEESASTV